MLIWFMLTGAFMQCDGNVPYNQCKSIDRTKIKPGSKWDVECTRPNAPSAQERQLQGTSIIFKTELLKYFTLTMFSRMSTAYSENAYVLSR